MKTQGNQKILNNGNAEWFRWAISIFLTVIVTLLLYSVSAVSKRVDRLEDKLERVYMFLLEGGE